MGRYYFVLVGGVWLRVIGAELFFFFVIFGGGIFFLSGGGVYLGVFGAGGYESGGNSLVEIATANFTK